MHSPTVLLLYFTSFLMKKPAWIFVSGKASREMASASKVYGRLARLSQDAAEGKDDSQEQLTVTDALDTMAIPFLF